MSRNLQQSKVDFEKFYIVDKITTNSLIKLKFKKSLKSCHFRSSNLELSKFLQVNKLLINKLLLLMNLFDFLQFQDATKMADLLIDLCNKDCKESSINISQHFKPLLRFLNDKLID